MPEELDVNKVVAAVVQENLEKVVSLGTEGVKGAKARVRSRLRRTYGRYVQRLAERYSSAKSFFVRMEAVPLERIYVPLDLENDQRRIRAPSFAAVASASRCCLITGSGGCGKSMLMRHLLVTCLQSGTRTPVFLELRDLNAAGDDLWTGLRKNLKLNGLDAEDGFLEAAFACGQIALFLDGFDELTHDHRQKVAIEVKDLAERFPSAVVIASSRPDSELNGWTSFVELRVAPLSLDSAVKLVQMVPFEEGVKKRFLKDLHEGLFEAHQSFLSNPLLLSIMLLTYSDVAHIPTKLSVFYQQAYESLFMKHDALKGGFQRTRRSKLDIQDFAHVFSAFSLQSYDAREFSFSRSRALELLDNSKAITQHEYQSSAVLADAVQAVCLLVEEGLDCAFAHRSFQEYFVAWFIRLSSPDIKKALIERFAPTIDADAVMRLLHEMDPFSVEAYFILPAIKRIRDAIGVKRKVGVTHYVKYLKMAYDDFSVEEGEDTASATIRDLPSVLAFSFVENHYTTKRWSGGASTAAAIRKVGEWDPSQGRHVIRASSLTTKHPLVGALGDTGHWGRTSLQEVLDAADSILARHADTASSLNELLSSKRGTRRGSSRGKN